MNKLTINYILRATCDLCGKARKKSLVLSDTKTTVICRDCLAVHLHTLDLVGQAVVTEPLEGE